MTSQVPPTPRPFYWSAARPRHHFVAARGTQNAVTMVGGCGNAGGFLPAILEKVLRLGELLVEFGRHPLLREALLLKGGTLVAKPATDVAGAARFRRWTPADT